MSFRYCLLPAIATLLLGAGCRSTTHSCADYTAPRSTNGSASNAATPANAGADSASVSDATRLVAEADIVQLDDAQKRIYAMSKGGTLALVDAGTPGALSLLGKVALPGTPFEMYRRGDVLVAMSNAAVHGDGHLYDANLDQSANPPDATASAAVLAVDMHDPAHPALSTTLKVPGEIADSRIVGNILYLATYEDATCWGCSDHPRTLVTTFDLTVPSAPAQVDQLVFDGASDAGGFNLAWSTPWKRSITVNANRMYVGGLASNPGTVTDEGVIQVVDISDPAGHLVKGATITTTGPIMSRWQMDETNGVLRIISQRGAGRTQNGESYPDIDTFRVDASGTFPRIGHTTMHLPQQEGLKTVRFDGSRAYAITFNQSDPLFTIDLSVPEQPRQVGQLTMPGWVFDIEPRGDRLLGLGLDRNDANGNLNVSLFDVSNLAAPALVNRVSFGPTNMYEDYAITSTVLAEDQDRIQKAFGIYDDGLVVVPFSGGSGSCTSGGVQLLDVTSTSLTKRALLPVPGNPRRAVRQDSPGLREVIAISDSNVRAFPLATTDAPAPLADVVIGTCVARTAGGSGFGVVGMPDDAVVGGDSVGKKDGSYVYEYGCE